MEFKADQIYTVKLNSGEELVGKFKNHSTDNLGPYIIISDPVSVGPGPQGGLGLVPSLFTVNPRSEVRLNTNSVSLIAETDETIKTKYIEATTGLKVPEKKVILG